MLLSVGISIIISLSNALRIIFGDNECIRLYDYFSLNTVKSNGKRRYLFLVGLRIGQMQIQKNIYKESSREY